MRYDETAVSCRPIGQWAVPYITPHNKYFTLQDYSHLAGGPGSLRECTDSLLLPRMTIVTVMRYTNHLDQLIQASCLVRFPTPPANLNFPTFLPSSTLFLLLPPPLLPALGCLASLGGSFSDSTHPQQTKKEVKGALGWKGVKKGA